MKINSLAQGNELFYLALIVNCFRIDAVAVKNNTLLIIRITFLSHGVLLIKLCDIELIFKNYFRSVQLRYADASSSRSKMHRNVLCSCRAIPISPNIFRLYTRFIRHEFRDHFSRKTHQTFTMRGLMTRGKNQRKCESTDKTFVNSAPPRVFSRCRLSASRRVVWIFYELAEIIAAGDLLLVRASVYVSDGLVQREASLLDNRIDR